MTCDHGQPMLGACTDCNVPALDYSSTVTARAFTALVEGAPLVYTGRAS